MTWAVERAVADRDALEPAGGREGPECVAADEPRAQGGGRA
jgi:hypothetical protein